MGINVRYLVFRLTSGPDFHDRPQYVERCTGSPVRHYIAAWTYDRSKARRFTYSVARAVAHQVPNKVGGMERYVDWHCIVHNCGNAAARRIVMPSGARVGPYCNKCATERETGNA